MNKKGFTLVELMVVIIVMGLLAAIGVPKLTGVIAKSRAAEVQPAAATYVKLQKAFIAEKGGVGTWKKIGYAGPGKKTLTQGVTTNRTKYFDYSASDEITSTIKPKFTTSLAGGKIGWVAENLNSLNDCAAGNKWIVKVYPVNDTTVEYKMESSFASNCSMLVSNWNQSDYGVTFGDVANKSDKENSPADIPLTPNPDNNDDKEEKNMDVVTAKLCDKNGWLKGQKTGWHCTSTDEEACNNEKAICFELRQKYFTDQKLSCVGNDKGIVDGIEVCNNFVYTAKGYSELFADGKKVVCKDKKSVSNHGNNPTSYCAFDDWVLATSCESVSNKDGVEYCAKAGSSSDDDEEEEVPGNSNDPEVENQCTATSSYNNESDAKKCCGESLVACAGLSTNEKSCTLWICRGNCKVAIQEEKCKTKTDCVYNYCSSY